MSDSDNFLVYKTVQKYLRRLLFMQTEEKGLAIKAENINNNLLKRLFDILFSIILFFLVFVWLFPIISILIKLYSKGRIFFIQDRVGLDGIIFKCYKFRTLPEKEINEEEKFVSSENIPVTGIGKILRKYNLDELPQFINVLKGEMSIVGPRPHAIIYHQKYAEYIKHINLRLFVKPGITGLAQINGYRGDVEDEQLNKLKTIKRIELDIQYIKQWTFINDIKVVLITFLQMAGLKK